MEKKEVREKVLACRQKMDDESRRQGSRMIHKKLLGLHPYLKAQVIMTYVSFGGEVDTKELIPCFFRDDKKVCVPDWKRSASEMLAVRIRSMNDLLCQDASGPAMPSQEKCPEIFQASQIDMILVPIVAFDDKGGRLGYGKGFYDKFLSLTDRCRAVGLAYDCQEVEEIPQDSHDVRIPTIITESKILLTS